MVKRISYIIFALIVVVLGLGVQFIGCIAPMRHPLRRRIGQCIFKTILFILRIKVRVKGHPSSQTPIFFVSNHISYMDILILGSVLDASFIAKSDVAKWPFIGRYAQMQGSIFIDRSKKSLATQRENIFNRIKQGDSLILFAEGTTHTGIHVLPFKSSLFQIFEQEKVDSSIQPITITYGHQRGIALGRRERHRLSWTGNLSVLPHLWILTAYLPLEVTIVAHKPIKDNDSLGRKQIALQCHEVVKSGIQKAFH